MLIICLILLQLKGGSPAQNSEKSLLFYKLAQQAFTENKMDYYLQFMDSALFYRPNYIPYYYQMAKNAEIQADSLGVFEYCKRIALMQYDFNWKRFAHLFKPSQIQEISNHIASAYQSNTGAEIVASYHFNQSVIEALLVNKGDILISNLNQSKVVKIGMTLNEQVQSGQIKFSEEQDRFVIFAIKSWSKYSYWISVSWSSQFNRSQSQRMAGLLQIDSDSHEILKSYLIKDTLEHAFGDFLYLNKDEILISDSKQNEIYILNTRRNFFKKALQQKSFNSLQGMLLSANENCLLVSDYSEGLFRVDLKDYSIHALRSPENLNLRGIDGLARHGSKIIATQNGHIPNRVLVMTINSDYNQIENVSKLYADSTYIKDPTLGQVVDNYFYFIANSGWPNVNENGTIRTNADSTAHRIMRLKIND